MKYGQTCQTDKQTIAFAAVHLQVHSDLPSTITTLRLLSLHSARITCYLGSLSVPSATPLAMSYHLPNVAPNRSHYILDLGIF